MKRNKLILTPVEKLPEKNICKNPLHDMVGTLETFMSMSCEFAKVEWSTDDYTDIRICSSCLRAAISTYKYPIKVVIRQGEVYLIKKNIT